MPFKIVRNDITKMETDAIVNTANPQITVGAGCDYAVYEAAGREKLLSYRKERIGEKKRGRGFFDARICPAGAVYYSRSQSGLSKGCEK